MNYPDDYNIFPPSAYRPKVGAVTEFNTGSTSDFIELTGIVLDATGKPLQAEYFYLGADGSQLSEEFFTPPLGGLAGDPVGQYSLYFPADTNQAATFVNFASTADYQPVVKTLAELAASPNVQLNKAGAGSGAVVPLVLAGGVALVLLARKKRGSVTGIREKYQAMDPTAKKIMLYGGLALGGYLAYKLLFSYKPDPGQQAEIDAANKQLADMARLGILPTLNATQFAQMVTVIVVAVNDCGTDEQAIYDQFSKLQNEADLYKLIATYKTQGYKGCFEGSYFGDVHHTLSQTLYGDLNQDEINIVNGILSDKGIQYQF